MTNPIQDRPVCWLPNDAPPHPFVEHDYVDEYFTDLIPKSDVPVYIYGGDDHSINRATSTALATLQSDFIVVHLSDERFVHDRKFYSRATIVFRSYFDPSITAKNVFTIPVGYVNGFRSKADTDEKWFQKKYA